MSSHRPAERNAYDEVIERLAGMVGHLDDTGTSSNAMTGEQADRLYSILTRLLPELWEIRRIRLEQGWKSKYNKLRNQLTADQGQGALL